MTFPPSPAQQKAAEAYVRNMAQRLGLSHWRCEVAAWHEFGNPDNRNDDAETFVATYTDRFKVYLYQRYWEGSPEFQRQVVVHELLHPHLDRAWTDVLDAAAEGIGGTATEALRKRTVHEVERTIERLAYAIAEFYPLPEEQLESA